MFRAKCRWSKLGEHPTKYFFALEKRNYMNKTMFAVWLDNNKIWKCQKRILFEQEKFYRCLYTSDKNIYFDIQNESGIRISETSKNQLDSHITMEELTAAAKDMKCNKVPGCDGLPIEFYREFWNELKQHSTNFLCIV